MLIHRQRRLLVSDVILERERCQVQRRDLLIHGTQLVAELRGDGIEMRNLLGEGGLDVVGDELALGAGLAGSETLLGLLQWAPGEIKRGRGSFQTFAMSLMANILVNGPGPQPVPTNQFLSLVPQPVSPLPHSPVKPDL